MSDSDAVSSREACEKLLRESLLSPCVIPSTSACFTPFMLWADERSHQARVRVLRLPMADAPLAGVEPWLSNARAWDLLLLRRCEAESDCAPKSVSEQATFFLRVEGRVSWLLIGRGARRRQLHDGDRVQQPQAKTCAFREARGSSLHLPFYRKKSVEKKINTSFRNCIYNVRTSIPPNDSRRFPTVLKKITILNKKI